MPLVSRGLHQPPAKEPHFWRRPRVAPRLYPLGTVWETGSGRKRNRWIRTYNAFSARPMWAWMNPDEPDELYGLDRSMFENEDARP